MLLSALQEKEEEMSQFFNNAQSERMDPNLSDRIKNVENQILYVAKALDEAHLAGKASIDEVVLEMKSLVRGVQFAVSLAAGSLFLTAFYIWFHS